MIFKVSQNVANVLKEICEGDMSEQDFAMIIRKIQQTMNDGLGVLPPTPEQEIILNHLLKLADQVKRFFV